MFLDYRRLCRALYSLRPPGSKDSESLCRSSECSVWANPPADSSCTSELLRGAGELWMVISSLPRSVPCERVIRAALAQNAGRGTNVPVEERNERGERRRGATRNSLLDSTRVVRQRTHAPENSMWMRYKIRTARERAEHSRPRPAFNIAARRSTGAPLIGFVRAETFRALQFSS